MRQLNVFLIFSFGLGAVKFTFKNTDPTTVHVLPGMATTLPLAVLLLLASRGAGLRPNPLKRCRGIEPRDLSLRETPSVTVPVLADTVKRIWASERG